MLRIAFVTAAALALSGCSNFCDEIDSLNVAFGERHKACDVDMTNRTFSKATCNANLHKCSKEDQEKIKKYTDCLKQLPVCTKDTMNTTWYAALRQCTVDSQVDAMSPACQDAIQSGRPIVVAPAVPTAPGAPAPSGTQPQAGPAAATVPAPPSPAGAQPAPSAAPPAVP